MLCLSSAKLLTEAILWKIFEGEMLISTKLTTLLEIFCELMLNSKVIFKNIVGQDARDLPIWNIVSRMFRL